MIAPSAQFLFWLALSLYSLFLPLASRPLLSNYFQKIKVQHTDAVRISSAFFISYNDTTRSKNHVYLVAITKLHMINLKEKKERIKNSVFH